MKQFLQTNPGEPDPPIIDPNTPDIPVPTDPYPVTDPVIDPEPEPFPKPPEPIPQFPPDVQYQQK